MVLSNRRPGQPIGFQVFGDELNSSNPKKKSSKGNAMTTCQELIQRFRPDVCEVRSVGTDFGDVTVSGYAYVEFKCPSCEAKLVASTKTDYRELQKFDSQEVPLSVAGGVLDQGKVICDRCGNEFRVVLGPSMPSKVVLMLTPLRTIGSIDSRQQH